MDLSEQTATSDRSWLIVAFKRLSPNLVFAFPFY